MRPIESLRPQLQGLDGRDFGAYQSILGSYAYGRFQLDIVNIPKDRMHLLEQGLSVRSLSDPMPDFRMNSSIPKYDA